MKMKIAIIAILFILCLAITGKSYSQNQFTIKLQGLNINDSATVIVQKSSEIYVKQLAVGNGTNVNEFTFNLTEGKWAINIDTKGYTFPPATTFDIPGVNSALVKLTPMLNDDFTYAWLDDDSYSGHATQVYVNEPSKLVVLDNTISVPSDYSSVKLRNEFGIILSNDKSFWTSEDSYRLYTMFKTLPIRSMGEGSVVDFEHGENVKSIFYLTDQEQNKDITIQNANGIKHVTISQTAFAYANPQIGNLDGIKMKFFSKRLNHAVLNYFTDFGSNEGNVNAVAQEKFGIRFMKSDQETESLMNEDASDFQEFFNEEKIEILSMFEELPEGFHKQEGLKYLVRRVNGQDNPKYPTASAIAWTGSNTIEFMSKAFNGTEINSTVRRLILHEKSHFLWGYAFNEELKKDWIDLGGWFKDPTSGSGWSTYNTTEFVTEYAHEKNPDEDMAESIATYILNPNLLLSRSVRKYEFIRDRIMHGTRYIAQIREDLTFTVYNLFPDYVYPGKIIGVNIKIKGKPEEDKEVSFEFKLNSNKPITDGASVGYIRLASIIGTIHDVWLSPKNGSVDSILVGTTTFSKHEKNGYWNLVSLRIEDPVKNSRYENTSTIGFKLYIENPLEDIIPPQWKYDLKMELVEGNFDESGQNSPNDVSGKTMQAIKYSYSFYDKSPMNRSITRIFFPKLDNPNAQIYEEQIQGRPIIDSVKSYNNSYSSSKHFEMYLGIPDYFPSGYYAVSMLNSSDIAENYSNVYMVEDTANFYIRPTDKNTFKDIRRGLYVKTLFPDYIAPEIDLNRISVTATPTNATAPDGETRVDISLLARDLSDFPTHESGVKLIRYFLRDPLGIEHQYSSWNDNMLLDYYSLKPTGNSNWQLVNLNITLPVGSPPGKWGISSMQTLDRAGNYRNYSFVEIVRFDVIKSGVVLTQPLDAVITNKLVNADNVSNIDVKISCKPGSGLNYIYTIYSLMGGNVVRGEGKMTGDEILLNGIDTKGVLDGVIKLTVQLTDSASQLIATKTVEYDKDTQRPSSYYTKTNLQDEGFSNLDNLIFGIVFEKSEIGGTYLLKIGGIDSNLKSASLPIITKSGTIDSDGITFSDIVLSEYKNKIIKTSLVVTDTCLNVGEPVYDYFLIEGDSIKHIKISENKAPVSYAGADQLVNEMEAITLDGSLSFDPKQNILTYKWTVPTGITLSSTIVAKPTFTAPAVNADTDYTFSLVVNDGTLDSQADQVIVHVKNGIIPQDIPLTTGWNIVSANVIPNNLEMQTIFQPLIDAGKLKKVMDEAGKTIENFGAFGGWKNNIGNLNSAKGYKVNVTSAATLSLEGTRVPLPLDLALTSGWNIISYPANTAQDAMALVQPLIDAGKLKKVMDETGKTIENFGSFGGWKNNIGNFLSGKGYKINVTANCTLTIPASSNKSATVLPEVLESLHYKKVYEGNGNDHFNVHLVNLASSGLQAGDEIGIFDGKYCVGSATIGQEQLLSSSISMPASLGEDEQSGNINGFTVGHTVTLQLYRANKNYPLNIEKVSGTESFEKNGSLFAKVTASNPSVNQIEDGLDQIKCYPNPFSDQITIEIRLQEPKDLEVGIFDLSGKLIRSLYKGQVGTSQKLVWDGRNGSGAKVISGTYILKANGMMEKIVLKH